MKSHAGYNIQPNNKPDVPRLTLKFLREGNEAVEMRGNECLIPSRVEDSSIIEMSIFPISHASCLIKKQNIILLKVESTVFLLMFTAVPSIFWS